MNQDQPTPQVNLPPGTVTSDQPPMRPAYRPYVTYILIGICVVVYLVQAGTSYFLNLDYPAALGVKDNSLILQGQLWRLFTPMFLHGSILHIGFNMWALFLIGPTIERFYGRWRYLGLYIVSGFGGNVISFMFSPYPSLGSSTAIFGLLAAEGVLIYQNRGLFGNIARRALSEVVIIAVVNLIFGLSPGIDNWGHIGGLIGGVLFAWFGGPVMKRIGVIPPFAVVDERSHREAIVAGIGVAALFIFLTAATMYLRRA
jgi:rhomboid protease GluP